MILGADKQNKNLRSAAKIKSNPTDKARTGNHYSAAISSSRSGTGTSGSTQVHQSKQSLNNGRPDPVRGSFEGLDNGKSTHVQMSGRGYDSSNLHGARYASKDKSITPARGSSLSFTNMGFKSIINNWSGVTMSGTSSDRMGNMLKMNRMF
jgi:hypothetical protein